MRFRLIFSTSVFLKSIFVISLFILLFISSITYKHTIALSETSELVVHSYKIQIQLEQLLSYLKDAETGQRGFLITGDSIFLEPYNTANEKIDGSFEELSKLMENNPQQYNNMDSLRKLINLRYEHLKISLDIYLANPLNKGKLENNLYKGKIMMDLIRNQIERIKSLEITNYQEHQLKYKHEIYFTPVLTLLLFIFSMLVFIVAFIKISKDLQISNKINQELLITTESFKHAEQIGDFSSWQWNLDTNILTYSDNQFRILGFNPQAFEPTVENFMKYVHPEDKHIISEGVNEILNGKNGSSAFFRIIRNDGKIRYIKSISKLTNHHGRILIGINSDVTEEYLNNIALEERNIELEQTNKELAFFNHMASHDLQEPLRKIQTFISRISDIEKTTMPENVNEYIDKIQKSVKGMRTLIDDLLIFSRTNKIEKNFELTDLNLLLHSAKQELAQIIEEKKAIITSVNLPELSVIPFQIQQLFINLISNSLKFIRPGISPIINIECEKITAEEDQNIKTHIQKLYFKITMIDNGLGFEQIEAENVFILFHRLHSKSEYPGSGIGLSICRKIVENHKGFIIADGKPGMGSAFTIYLPA